jgi:hypothetical protein
MNPKKSYKKPDWLDKIDLDSIQRKLKSLRRELLNGDLEPEHSLSEDDCKELIKVLEWLESPRGRGRYEKGFKLKQRPLLPGLFMTDKGQFEALRASGKTKREAYDELTMRWGKVRIVNGERKQTPISERSVRRRINKPV